MAAWGRRGALRAHQPEPGEPERKRACKPSETIPNEADAHLIDCAMELDSKQKISADCCPWATKTKPNSMIFENHVSRGTAQPCPRCIAGESMHRILAGERCTYILYKGKQIKHKTRLNPGLMSEAARRARANVKRVGRM